RIHAITFIGRRDWFHAASAFAFALLGLACLPVLSGCGHESAASPVNPPASIRDLSDENRPDGPALVPDGSAAQNSNHSPVSADSTASVSDAPTDVPSKAPNSGQRPPADRAPPRPGEAEKITFDDLNLGMQADVVFRPFMISDRVKELEGRKVSLVGYMHGGQAAQKGIKEFILLKNTQCKFG